MKRMKKIASMLLAVVMVLGMSMSVFAAENNSPVNTPKDEGNFEIKLTGVESNTHQYSAYQVFKGDLSENGTEKVLSNIEWGNSINEDKLLDLINALKGIELDDGTKPFFEGLSEEPTAAEVAGVLSENVDKSALAVAFADVVGSVSEEGSPIYFTTTNYKSSDEPEEHTTEDGKTTYNYTISNLPGGYYLVQDSGTGNVEAYTRNILEVVSNVTAKVKSEIPTVEKKIVEGNQKVDANNAGVGKVVSYEVKGKVPDTTGYDYYFYIINDTLSKGLTFNKDVSITVGGAPVEVYAVEANKTTLTDEEKAAANAADVVVYEENVRVEDGVETRLQIAFNDIMASKFTKGAEILVHYSATVNSDAIIGNTGNPNTVTLTYSNNPNHNYKGDKDNEKPGRPDSTKKPPTGETPEDKTITYVAEIDIQKTFSDIKDITSETILPNATFTLTGISHQAVLTTKTYYEEDPNGTYYLLKNGTYTEEDPRADITMTESTNETAGYVVYTPEGEDYEEGTVQVGGVFYRPYKSGDTGTIYTLVEPNVEDYVSAIVKYKKETASVTEVVETKVNMIGTTDENGKLTFKGLGAGDYTITETGVPAGYNKAEPVTVKIECKVPTSVSGGDETAEWTFNGTVKNTTGIYSTEIVNNKGSLLPSTGGIGTTIFYVVGGILVIGAGILLVAKKRMGRN